MFNQDWLLGLLLIAAIIAAYQQVWHAGFVWDDDSHLTTNPCIVGPVGFKGIWTTSAAVYYPLVLTSFWVIHALCGLNPLPYHLVNVAVQAACAILLWRVLRRLNVRGAWLGAALWALHPVQVESVAWITELKNTQSCFFYLLSIYLFLKWLKPSTPAGRGSERNYALALVCAALAILSKSSTVMLPVILGLCWWWMKREWKWRNLPRLAPFFLISILAGVWTIWEQQFHSGAMGAEWSETWPQRIVIAGKDVWFYLGKLIWPQPLIFIYPRWPVTAAGIISWLPALAAAIALLGLWLGRRRTWPLFFAFAYFVISLFPVLDFFKVYFFRYSFVGDHFQYLASIGPLALLGAAITTALGTFRAKTNDLAPAIYGVLLLTLCVLTWHQTQAYQGIDTLWTDTLKKNPDCWLAHLDIGSDFYLKQGQVTEAITHFQQAVEIKPDYSDAEFNLGVSYARLGQKDDAITHYEKTIAISPDYFMAHDNLGVCLFQQGKTNEALQHFQQALQLKPDFVDANVNIGNALMQMGKPDEAIPHLQKALESKPNSAVILNNLGNAFLQVGKEKDAIDALQKAMQLDPSDPSIKNNLAWILATSSQASLRDGAKAVELAARANIATGAKNPFFLHTLAAAYAGVGRFSDAEKAAQRALQLAKAQSNTLLAEQLESDVKVYQAGGQASAK